jgi:hypothetical protein
VARLLHLSRWTNTERAMADRPADGGSFPEDRYTNPETALGGADAVEKTTFVIGRGGEPEGRTAEGAPTARVRAGGGQGTAWIIIAFLVVAADTQQAASMMPLPQLARRP